MKRWEPFPAQRAFLACPAYEALYGGSVGGGKSECGVMGALRHVDKPSYRALILRRTFPELQRDIIPLTEQYYPWASGIYNVQTKTWRFPSGAAVELGHLEKEQDVEKYKGLEVQYIDFDELTTFTEKQYVTLLSRLRGAHGVPIRARAGTNPGGIGQDWVLRRWAPWLETDDNLARLGLPRARSGEVLRYRNTEKGEVYDATGALTRVFFRAKLDDNPYLADTDYAERLMGLDPLTRAQLLRGDWHARAAAGMLFRRGWFKFVDAAPARARRVRRWDLASIEGGGDWTVGVKLAYSGEGDWCVEDVVRAQLSPRGVEKLVRATAEIDGKSVVQWLPEDPGQAGKAQAAAYSRLLKGFAFKFVRETGDKVTRAKPASAQVEAGNVSIVRAPWNEPFLQCLEAFPEGAHDDDADAFAGAMTAILDEPLTTMQRWAGGA